MHPLAVCYSGMSGLMLEGSCSFSTGKVHLCQGGFSVEAETEEATDDKRLENKSDAEGACCVCSGDVRRDLMSLVLNIEQFYTGKSSSAGWDEQSWPPFVHRIGHF